MSSTTTSTGVVFASSSSQILSTTIHLLGVSIISFIIGRRSILPKWSPTNPLSSISWARLAVFAVFLDSWCFLFSTGLLVNGVGLASGSSSCAAAIDLCIAFYVTSKFFIYVFLSEKVYIVWSAGTSVSRRSSIVYRICFCMLVIYAVIICLMVVGRVSLVRDDQSCLIGLRSFASIPLLSYDLFLNIFLTSLFIIPILRENFTNTGLRAIAIRTLVAATVALTTSTVNILILAVLQGHELGWVCLASCSTDVAINAFALFWVTARVKQNEVDIPQRRVSFVQTPLPITFANQESSIFCNDDDIRAERSPLPVSPHTASLTSRMLPRSGNASTKEGIDFQSSMSFVSPHASLYYDFESGKDQSEIQSPRRSQRSPLLRTRSGSQRDSVTAGYEIPSSYRPHSPKYVHQTQRQSQPYNIVVPPRRNSIDSRHHMPIIDLDPSSPHDGKDDRRHSISTNSSISPSHPPSLSPHDLDNSTSTTSQEDNAAVQPPKTSWEDRQTS